MLTHKTIKTISVNLRIIFCLGCKSDLSLSNPNKIENDRFKGVRLLLYIKVYLSIGIQENRSHSYYTEKSKNVKPYTIIIPKKVNFPTPGVRLCWLLCKTLFST